MTDLVVRYLHFIGIFVMFSMLTLEHLFLKNQLENKWIKKLAIFDLSYGIAAVVTLLCGLGMWLWVGKPAGFYSGNWIFHTKITLFILIGLLSIIPTRFILKQRKNTAEFVHIPKYITMIIRLEMLLICTIPLLAVLMANGVGYTR